MAKLLRTQKRISALATLEHQGDARNGKLLNEKRMRASFNTGEVSFTPDQVVGRGVKIGGERGLGAENGVLGLRIGLQR